MPFEDFEKHITKEQNTSFTCFKKFIDECKKATAFYKVIKVKLKTSIR